MKLQSLINILDSPKIKELMQIIELNPGIFNTELIKQSRYYTKYSYRNIFKELKDWGLLHRQIRKHPVHHASTTCWTVTQKYITIKSIINQLNIELKNEQFF